MSKKQERSRERNKKSKSYDLQFDELVEWLKGLEVKQLNQEEWEELGQPLMWPGRSLKLPLVEIAISVFIPLLPDHEWEEVDPVVWDFSILNLENTRYEYHKEYNSREELLEALQRFGGVMYQGYGQSYDGYLKKFLEKNNK